jgi:hypothetical protein
MSVVSRGMMVCRDLSTCHVFDLEEVGFRESRVVEVVTFDELRVFVVDCYI